MRGRCNLPGFVSIGAAVLGIWGLEGVGALLGFGSKISSFSYELLVSVLGTRVSCVRGVRKV